MIKYLKAGALLLSLMMAATPLQAARILVLAENQYEQFYQAVLGFQINAGLNDAWFNPATNGHRAC